MARDEFPARTKETLAKRAGSICSKPECLRVTVGPGADPAATVNLGVAAHITAASPGGPRFDPTLTPEQRSLPENGIWLCQTCAKLVDSDEEPFPPVVLRAWKTLREHRARLELEGKLLPDKPPAPLKLELRWAHTDSSDGERHDYKLSVMARNNGDSKLNVESAEIEIPSVVIDQPRNHHTFKPDRSTSETAFFRNEQPKVLHPGDETCVASISYYIDRRNYFDRGNLFDRPVRATVRIDGHRPTSIERPFGRFQRY